ncbi:MAG: two-component sensor histidine kinase [Gemmatimonadetes bacterium]|nr:two-component sensor histidine kinase [Gemmatimonadota bacterium]
MNELSPDGPVPGGMPEREGDSIVSERRYRRILVAAVLSVSLVAIVPLIIATAINYFQYQEAFREEQSRPMVRFAANGKLALEAFLEERTAALRFVSRTQTHEELTDSATLAEILEDMKASFGGFSDLGVIEADGTQLSYAGPYELEGRNYREAPWFQEVLRQGIHVSEVFLGFRDFPHFVIATYRETGRREGFVLRATIDTEYINRLVSGLLAQPGGDVFLVNHEGVLQTPSRSHGDVLTPARIPSLPYSTQTELLEVEEPELGPRLAAYTQITGSPFVLAMVSPGAPESQSWTGLRRNLLLFLAASTLLILAVVIWGSHWMVNRARDADIARAAVYHRMEYENKMAALGRLSAGVAHEINNPVSIISEKAGLLKDLLLMSEAVPPREKMLDLLDSVLRSADRCGGITHRLLGFAKHMQVQTETIELDQLLVEVLGFLEKEAAYRDIQIELDFPEEAPEIVSDRGQLQQVFLNVLNNAFGAVDDGGKIQIGIIGEEPDRISVWVQDNGIGIPEENLSRIFDPFFTTKKGAGTGLGLSITYGIVQKLGGEVSVQSQVGVGTRFILTFPIGTLES